MGLTSAAADSAIAYDIQSVSRIGHEKALCHSLPKPVISVQAASLAIIEMTLFTLIADSGA